MQAMMKEEIGGLRQEMNERFEASEKRMGQMMDEKLDAQDKRIDEKMAVQTRQLEQKINAISMTQDNHYQKIQNLIKEGYSPVEAVARETKAKVADYDEVKRIQADHARAIQQHNERITELEKSAI